MSGEKRLWTDERLEFLVANLLRGGVLLVAMIVAVGGVVYLWRHGMEPTAYQYFRGEPADLRTLSGIVAEVFAFRGRSLIQLGLLLLITVPVGRVALAMVAFYKQRDRLYFCISLIVLTLLLYSLFSVTSL